MFLRIRYVILAAAWVIGFPAMTVYSVLLSTYVSYPRVANPKAGLVVPHVVKGGATVYITSGQQLVLDCLSWTLLGLAAVVLIILVLNQKWPLDRMK